MSEPEWVSTSIWWHVYPLGALGADTTGRDRAARRPLSTLIGWLDHALRLGVNGLALGPIFQSSSHGYDTLDHLAIDDRLGTIDDFTRLVDACRQRGIRIMIDGVFNHVGRDHPLVADPQAALESGWALADSTGDLRTFEGHEQLVALNHANPAVAQWVTDIMCHWLDAGADAWRLDAAYAVPKSFWRHVLPVVKGRHPESYVVGEVIHRDYADTVARTGMDSITQYELWKAIWSAITDDNMHELAWAIQRHNEMLATFTPWTFIGNHDVTRIATTLEHHHPQLATVLLATLPGTPAVYYGDELGWTGVKEERVGGDDAIRSELPHDPPADTDLPAVFRLYQRLLGIRRRFGLHAAPIRTDEVRQGFLRFASTVGDGGELVVAINSGNHHVHTRVDGVTWVDGEDVHHDGADLHVAPGGWFIGRA